MKNKFYLIGMVVLTLVGVAIAQPPQTGNITVFPEVVLQGDCFYINVSRLPEDVSPVAHWAGKEVPLYPGQWGWRTILPVWVETKPGPQMLAVSWKEGNRIQRCERTITVKKTILRHPASQTRRQAGSSLYPRGSRAGI